MTSWRARLRLTVPLGLAAFMLTVAGALTPAAAATNWYFVSYNTGSCLKAPTGFSPYVGDCSGSSHSWHWGSESNTWDGHTMRRLVNNQTGDCLTTDDAYDYNSVWMAPCGGGRSGQFWTADGSFVQNQNHNYLAADDDGSLYSQLVSGNIIPDQFVWSDYRF
ncbi:ricin-type beta-trefoil lectin domain protein [Streptomyces sp. NPDC002680]|uniref:ricin-type beta-trefoil lectin domain protein n=1 Tax=Streptomyces sp. NPDC002680 TaxID=3364659 RepID=UPI003682BF30